MGDGMMNWLNSTVSRIDKAAKERVRQRLAQRTEVAIPDLLEQAAVPSGLRDVATNLAIQLGRILGSEAGVLRADDRLDVLLRVDAQELPSISADEWGEARLKQRLIVHSYDIMHLVETFSDGDKWKQKWTTLAIRPQSEEQWIDLILVMTVGEFLNFFAPLARGTQAVT